MDRTDKISRLQRIRELALRGVGGEQENAQRLLDELMEKYDVTFTELDDSCEEIEDFIFWYKGEAQRSILCQIHYKVTNNTTYYRLYKNERLSKTKLKFKCTKSQKIEIEFLFDFYRRLWEEEYAVFLKAFICKHELWGESDDKDRDSDPMTYEEIRRLREMMHGLKDASPLLALEEGVEE